MKKTFLVIVAFFSLAGCTRPDQARRVLTAEGFTDIDITGYGWFACSDDDTFHTAFVAKKNGQEVRGVVCAGLFFKGATVRFK